MSAPFVLLHPLGADAAFWDPVRAELRSCPSMALDLPGHGSMPPLPRGAGIDAFAGAVANELATYDEPVHLVGMSLGGLVAQQIGWGRADLVASVVLVDTVAVYPDPMRQMWHDRAQTARTDGLASLVDPMVEMWFSPELASAGDPRVERARQTFSSTDPEGYARSCDLLADVDLQGRRIPRAIPTAVVCGHDDAPAFRDGASWLADSTNAETVRWLPGRHACCIEAPGDFASILVSISSG
jgi:3-oxoadipate enol-lactonase